MPTASPLSISGTASDRTGPIGAVAYSRLPGFPVTTPPVRPLHRNPELPSHVITGMTQAKHLQ